MRRYVALFTFLTLAPLVVSAPVGESHIPLPVSLSGTLNGAAYRIEVPANWNGTLLVFAHGTQVQPGLAEIAPVAWPSASPSVEQALLESGYALAGSGFENSPKKGTLRTLALANFFKGRVGNPSRTIIWGNSLGGLIALMAAETHPGAFDGVIANCAPAAGRAENADWALAFGVAYAAAFGWHDEAWGPVEDIRDDLDFFTEVRPIVPWPPANYGRWEFIRLVMKLAPQAFWGKDPQTNSFFFGLQMWKATGQRAAVEAEAGGPVGENVGHEYALTVDEIAYLGSLGVNATELLATMNARANIAAERSARNHVEQWGGVSGGLRVPVLTMHSVFDGLAPVYNEDAYRALVEEAGAAERLVQAYVSNVGHCSFSAEQYLSVVEAMNAWLDTGMKPSSSELPPEQGFDLTYEPSTWPF